MYVKCIDAHGTQLEKGRVYEVNPHYPSGARNIFEGDFVGLVGFHNADYGSYRFVEASNADLVIAINKGHIKME